MELLTEDDVIALMRDGWTLSYAPLSGGVCLAYGEGEPKWLRVEMFLDLRERGIIEQDSIQGQGHHIFHGRVCHYKLTE